MSDDELFDNLYASAFAAMLIASPDLSHRQAAETAYQLADVAIRVRKEHSGKDLAYMVAESTLKERKEQHGKYQ